MYNKKILRNNPPTWYRLKNITLINLSDIAENHVRVVPYVFVFMASGALKNRCFEKKGVNVREKFTNVSSMKLFSPGLRTLRIFLLRILYLCYFAKYVRFSRYFYTF